MTLTNSLRKPVLGCIADDVTGATDLAINLVQGGMRVVQVMGVPTLETVSSINADAIVVALKSRSVPAADAVSQSLASLESLEAGGVKRFFFKYCSTFDSTPKGNIGPVAAALMAALSVQQCLICPAFPRNGRTVYRGHLFVNDALLNESGMEHHPLNPMTDSNLVRFLKQQTDLSVGLVGYESVNEGAASISSELDAQSKAGIRMVVADACDDRHLQHLADAVSKHCLSSGGSGIARYLPDAYRKIGLLESKADQPRPPEVAGRNLILAGSCSNATHRQVSWMKERCPTWQANVEAIVADQEGAQSEVLQWAREQAADATLMVYSTSPPEQVQRLQAKHGADAVASAIESFLASVAKELVDHDGFRRLVLAGGETSGAVVNRLGVRALRIGPEICAGVPWTESMDATPLALALKSGNFGDDQFFERAFTMLSAQESH